MKPEHYYELPDRKICHYCQNSGPLERDSFTYHQWCHLYHFECSPVGNCEDWEAAEEVRDA